MGKWKVLIKDNIEYKSKIDGRIWKLKKDYNGRWYMSYRDDSGYSKMLSVSKAEMRELIDNYYERCD